jgi:hypothetical protein
VFVEPGVEVHRVEADQATDPDDRDAALLHQATEMTNARAQLLSYGVDIEQPAIKRDGSGWGFGSACRCHRQPYSALLRPKRDQRDVD